MNLKTIALIAGLLCGFVVFGCSTVTGKIDPASAEAILAQGGLQMLTLKYTAGDPDKAQALVDGIDKFVASLDAPASPADIKAALTAAVPWEELDAAEKVGALRAIDAAVLVLEKRVPIYSTQVPVDEIKLVLGWVREAAALEANVS